MIGLAQNQSTNSARSYPIWRLGTYARNSQKTGTNHHNGRDLLEIIWPMLLPKPKQVALNPQILRLSQLMLGRNTRVQTPPLTNSP
jgi:hypothetical protein